MKIVDIPIDQLVPAEWNPNQMDSAMQSRLRESVKRFGLVENLVVRRVGQGSHEVLSGNQRLQILKEMNSETIPCVVVDLDDGRARLLAQALNRIEGEDDLGLKAELVRNILKEIPTSEVLDLLPETGESLNALASLGEGDLTLHLQNWEKSRAVKLHTLQLRLTEDQLHIVQEALGLAGSDEPKSRGHNQRSAAITAICNTYLKDTKGR